MNLPHHRQKRHYFFRPAANRSDKLKHGVPFMPSLMALVMRLAVLRTSFGIVSQRTFSIAEQTCRQSRNCLDIHRSDQPKSIRMSQSNGSVPPTIRLIHVQRHPIAGRS
jgi:hypothetical protein